jgi:PAS domain S-box-containing protein
VSNEDCKLCLSTDMSMPNQQEHMLKMSSNNRGIAARNGAADELRRNEAFLAEAQRLSKTGSFGWNVSTGEIFWSEESYRIFQYDPTTKPTVELVLQRVHPEDMNVVQQTIESASQEGKDYQHKYRLVMPDGSVKHLHIVAHATKNKSGELEFVGAVMDITQEKQSQETVERQKTHLDELFMRTPAPIALLDVDGEVLRVNREFESLFQYTVEEAVGRNLVDLIIPEEMQADFENNKRLLQRDERIDMETVRRRKDGERLIVHLVGVRVSLPNGKVGVYAIYRDVTARNKAADELRRKEAFLAEGQRLSKTGSYGWKVATGELFWSEETYRIYQYDPTMKPVIPMVYQRVHPEDLQAMEQVCKRASQEGKDYQHKFRAVMPDGSLKHIHIVAHAERDKSGNLEYVGAVMDVTEREKARVALEEAIYKIKKSEDQLQTIIDAIPAQVWCALPDGSSEFQNRPWLEYSGLSAEESRGWGWRSVLHPDDAEQFLNKWLEIRTSQVPGEMEARFRHSDGEYRWFLVRAVPMRDESGNISKWFGTNTDIDDRKHAEKLLAGENRILEMIAGGDSLSMILDNLCWLIEELSCGCLCGIVLVDNNGRRLEHGAAPSLPPSYNDAIHGRPVGTDSGPCATAAFLKDQIIAADISSDTRWETYAWCPLALAHGLRSCWSTPILSSGGIALGVFAIYWRESRTPTSQDQKLIKETTHLAAIAIERKRSEEEMRRSEARLEEAQRIAHVGYWERDLVGDLINWSSETYRIFGLPQQKDVLNLSQLQNLLHPEDRQIIIQGVADALKGVRPYDVEYRIIRPNGEMRFVHSKGDVVKDESGRPHRMFGTVQDITERKQAAEALRATELIARGQVNALTRTLDALAKESAPDRLVEHVLRTIADEFKAHSSSVWRIDEVSGQVSFEFALEGGKLATKSDRKIVTASPSMPIELVWPLSEDFHVGKPSVLEDISQIPAFPWRDYLLSQGVVTILCVPMLITGQVKGVTGIRFTCKRTFRVEEIELAQALANQAMLAMELTRLSTQSRQSAVIAERNRVARDIHDTLAQGFTGVIVHLGAASEATAKGLTQKSADHLSQAEGLARGSLAEARRSVQALRPLALEENNLCDALEDLFTKMTKGTSLRSEFICLGTQNSLPDNWDENILHIGQEILTNALRHAQASLFQAQIAFAPTEVRLDFRDNGCGFTLGIKNNGFGLPGIKERVETMGGQLTVECEKGKGTAIMIVLPIPDNAFFSGL